GTGCSDRSQPDEQTAVTAAASGYESKPETKGAGGRGRPPLPPAYGPLMAVVPANVPRVIAQKYVPAGTTGSRGEKGGSGSLRLPCCAALSHRRRPTVGGRLRACALRGSGRSVGPP